MIVSATSLQAAARLRAIRAELRNNTALRAAFPALVGRITEASQQSLCVAGMRVMGLGAGTEMRGFLHDGWRPTKIILDDAEDSERVLSARLREATEAWFREVILPLGDRYTHVEIVGTLLHRKSLLASLLEAPAFEKRIYRAVEQWPDREDLWTQWQHLRTNPNDNACDATAAEFFSQNRDAMLAGTRVLWPEKEPFPQLMEQMLVQGRVAFFKEKQNEPPTGLGALFEVERWRRFSLDGKGRIELANSSTQADIAEGALSGTCSNPNSPAQSIQLDELEIVGFLDPALGGADYAAIATVGRDPRGVLYVLDVWQARVSPAQQIAQAFDLYAQWGYARFGFEANAFQAMLVQTFELERAQRLRACRPAQLPWIAVKNLAAKATRIAALEPLASAGWLLFRDVLPRTFLLEADSFPHGQSDDGLDAVAGAVALLGTRNRAHLISTVASRERRPRFVF